MKTILKKTFLLGLGAASLSAKAAQRVAQEYVKKGLVPAKQASALAKEMILSANKQRKQVQGEAERAFQKELKRYGVKSVQHLKGLKKKAATLERMLKKGLKLR